MVLRQRGEVVKVTAVVPDLQRVVVRLSDGSEVPAVCFRDLVGTCNVGDQVVINSTARVLGLGSGGWDFVIAITDQDKTLLETDVQPVHGHLVKLRYTPLQTQVLAWDEVQSPARPSDPTDYGELDGIPVMIAGVHSLVEPTVRAVAALVPGARIAYIQTDAACLPAWWSQVVAELKDQGVLSAVISSGHSFGGDYEALNNYSALACAKEAVRADFIMVSMGPGIPGTGTKYGSTAIEVGELINAAAALGGQPIAIPRLSFADARPRHRGISHHFLTALQVAAYAQAEVPFPYHCASDRLLLQELTTSARLDAPNRHGVKHQLSFHDVSELTTMLEPHLGGFRSMGRGFSDDPLHFGAGFAAGLAAISLRPRIL